MNPSLVSIAQNVILGPDCSGPESGAHPVTTTELSSTVSLEFKAATMVQKFYRSHRTRRRLADSDVAHKFWWHALDFAFLNNSTISFFKEQKQEAALKRLKRIQSNASRVGKGLAIDGKALKLAFQHWIEAIDPRHRYGHNLQFYYQKWYKNQAGQPFFYWLDVGAGRDVDLNECSRSMLRQQRIKYLGPLEREQYEYKAIDGKIVHKQTGRLLDTAEEYNKAKWIFVMSTSRRLYAGQKIKGKFHHSSFLAGGATVIAGRLVTENGLLKRVWPHSGHYRPTEENLENFTSFLIEHGIDLKDQVSLSYDDNDVEVEKHAQALDTTAVSGVDEAIQVIEVELA